VTEERLCSIHDVEPGTARRFDLGSLRLCVVRLEDGWYCIGDRCSHENIPLSDGEVLAADHEIECWKHGSAFSLDTGEPSTLPATKPVPVYDLRVDGEDVYLVVP
jgi:3-phenylpropionate/trans-cinnamate dioxygenase ferredoxin subunit